MMWPYQQPGEQWTETKAPKAQLLSQEAKELRTKGAELQGAEHKLRQNVKLVSALEAKLSGYKEANVKAEAELKGVQRELKAKHQAHQNLWHQMQQVQGQKARLEAQLQSEESRNQGYKQAVERYKAWGEEEGSRGAKEQAEERGLEQEVEAEDQALAQATQEETALATPEQDLARQLALSLQNDQGARKEMARDRLVLKDLRQAFVQVYPSPRPAALPRALRLHPCTLSAAGIARILSPEPRTPKPATRSLELQTQVANPATLSPEPKSRQERLGIRGMSPGLSS